MSLLSFSDILKALDRWEEWKKIQAAPAAIEELTRRVADLEKLIGPAPGDRCPHCGKLAFRIEKSQEPMGMGEIHGIGILDHHWKCQACDYTVVRREMPK